MNSNKTVEQIIEEYGRSIIKKDYKKTVEFIYPKLFDFIPKKTIENALKHAYSNKEIDIKISNYNLDAIDFKQIINDTEYLIIQTSFNQVITYLVNNEETQEEANFHYEMLKEKYGELNVLFNDEINQITANSTSIQLAINENGNWTFLDVKPNLTELYSKFLPESIIDKLTALFPKSKVEDIELSVEHVEKIKLNTVLETEIGKNIQVIYLLGWEVLLNGDEDCENFISTQITNKKTFEFASVGLELVFKDGKLTLVNEYNDGIRVERALKKEEIGLQFCDYKENKILNLRETINGPHQLGGEMPVDFHLPDNNCVVPFQYLGFIDNQDMNFNWLPFKLHLACPIYLNIGNVFMDYTNPLKPSIINREEVEQADTSYDEDLNPNSEIVFNEMTFSFIDDVEFSVTGHSGIPNWIQYPNIPKCPKSGKRMKFLCQLNGGVTAKRTNVLPKDEWYRHYYEELNFWGDGDLFVFFEPTSKVACYFIQNT